VQRRRVLGAAAAVMAAGVWPGAAPAQTAGSSDSSVSPGSPGWADELRRRLAAPPVRPGESVDMARQRLLDDAEAQLQAGQALAALATFEQASLMQHAADIEMGIVRAQMAAGEFRRALAFAAHTAGAHRDQPGGTALYAWLLSLCGQQAPALRLLDGAIAQGPQPLLHHARTLLDAPAPVSDDLLRQRPWRVAPYGHGGDTDHPIDSACQVAGTGLLLSEGDAVLVPGATVAGTSRIWVRDSAGRTVLARREDGCGGLMLQRLVLAAPLPAPPWDLAPRDPFAGSPGCMVEYAADPAGAPAWPQLREGFFAGVPGAPDRALGFAAAPGPRGGPVFDRAGRLCGIALADASGRDRLLAPSHWPARLAAGMQPDGRSSPAPQVMQDQIYERAMRLAVQILIPPPA
jgi:hypothetical protein